MRERRDPPEQAPAVRPVIFAVDGGVESFREIEHELIKRYGDDYLVETISSPRWALEVLGRLESSGRRVALVLASQWMPDMDGADFLARTRLIFPNARRALLVDRWDASAQGPVVRAMTLGHTDYYIHKPAQAGDEEFHRVISGFLYEWCRVHYPSPEGVRVIGEAASPRSHELREMLGRNAIPHHFHGPESETGRDVMNLGGHARDDLPLVALHDGRVLANPTNVELADAVGTNVPLERRDFDLVVVGAGPAGLAAAVYAASEGLDTLVLEGEAIGGQAGTSSHIRNYLGFARGIEGSELAREAADQARLFGATFHLMRTATALRRENGGLALTLSDDTEVRGRAAVVATGASYRRLGIPALEALVGTGVFYGAAVSEARGVQGEEVFVLGGANSAGQAAVHLSEYASRVTLLVRAPSLATSMSEYLIQEIGATPNIEVRAETTVTGGGGDGRLERLTLRHAGAETMVPASALFVLIGAEPRTGWLPEGVERDARGYIVTGPDLLRDAPPAGWSAARVPLAMETSMPGVFAAGDVRYGSVKRVASAVGAGAIAVQSVHAYLAGAGVRRAATP